MAGINLLDQLKAKKGSGLSNTPSSSPKMNFSMGTGSGESLGIALRVILLIIIGYGGFLGLQRYHEEQSVVIQDEISQIETSMAQENRKKNQMKSIGEEMRGYQTRVDELQGKLNAVSQQETDRSYLIRALEYAATEMPREMWFNEITAEAAVGSNSKPQSATATFKGYAINAQAVSEFIQKLENSVYFPSTTLDRLELVAGSEISSPAPGVINVPPNSRRFQIMAKLGE
ncbi:MAG: PilN domain-containing protein [Bdellovibrionota bacterium]